MDGFEIKGYSFANGTPRICIPLIGCTRDEILGNAHVIREHADASDARNLGDDYRVAVIEWRADYFDGLDDPEKLKTMLSEIRDIFPDKVLLFTFRSEEEGGEFRHDRVGSHLFRIYETVAATGLFDMIDVELMRGNYRVARATNIAHEAGMKVVMSYHNFNETPHDSDLREKLKNMEVLGGDILKVAVMPKNDFDTRRMIELSLATNKERSKPSVIIAMGKKGEITRIIGRETGACLTFASCENGSAPGQLGLEELIDRMRKPVTPINL